MDACHVLPQCVLVIVSLIGGEIEASLMGQQVKNPSVMQETQVWSLTWEGSNPGGNSYPLQYSRLKNTMDRGAWATKHMHVRTHTHTHTVRLVLWWSEPPLGAGWGLLFALCLSQPFWGQGLLPSWSRSPLICFQAAVWDRWDRSTPAGKEPWCIALQELSTGICTTWHHLSPIFCTQKEQGYRHCPWRLLSCGSTGNWLRFQPRFHMCARRLLLLTLNPPQLWGCE